MYVHKTDSQFLCLSSVWTPPPPRWPLHPCPTADSRGKAARKRWTDHIPSQWPTSQLCTPQSLWMTGKNLFTVTSTHIQSRLFYWHCTTSWLRESRHHLPLSRTFCQNIPQLNLTRDSCLTLVPQNNRVLFCKTGLERWSWGMGVGCQGSATLPKDNSSLLSFPLRRRETTAQQVEALLAGPGGRRTLTEINS